MVYPYNSMYRLHYPSECIFNGSASLGENSLLLLETKNANATWRFFSSQNEEKFSIKLRYTSKLNSVKLKVIHKGPSLSITKFLYLYQI